MEIVRRETLTPEQAGMPWMSHRDDLIVRYRMRCKRGCIGVFWQPAPRAVLLDTRFLADMDDTALEYAAGHVCLRKVVAGDRHRCWVCGWAGVVNRRGELREHYRHVGDPCAYFWGGGPLETEICPAVSVGRKVGA